MKKISGKGGWIFDKIFLKKNLSHTLSNDYKHLIKKIDNLVKMKNTCFFAFLILAATLSAQDLHLSNYHAAGMLFNPALTAAGKSDVRAGVQYRSQWAAIPPAYTTLGATGELRRRQLGFGMQVNQNRAGEASLKSTTLMFTGAYHKPLAQEGTLSIGVGIGRLQKQVNPALLTFDNQYVDESGFDPSLPSGETFQRTTAAATDFTAGLLWRGSWGETGKLASSLGLSLAHAHLPDQGFFGEKAELPMRSTVHGSLDIDLDRHVTLTPHFLLQKQGAHRELLAGVRFNGSFDKKSQFHAGMAYRTQDAVIIQAGFEIGNKEFWASYDANISSLEGATGGRGAWEFALYLRFDHQQKKQVKDSDGDGVNDHRDDCPKVPGLPELKGCPPVETDEKPDTDADGVTDDLDRCPLEPGLPCFYGCNDRDRDGTLDQDDACPEIFGHPENKGCPLQDRDADRDGVPDSEDFCVFLKGSPAFHGCPDSDNDGISDIDDHCPYLKGSKLRDGCPDNGKSATAQLPDVLVEFATDESFIEPVFQMELIAFARQIIDHPNVRLIVAGHTDAEGTAAYNYELGLSRAKTVRDFLIRQGIPASRMEMMSYGEAMPKRNNESVSGRAENRRTEVIIRGE